MQHQQHGGGTKLEKAELLEMTVAYVGRVQSDVSRQRSLGFATCMREVDAFLAAQTGTGSDADAQLRAHLVRRLSRCRRRRRHLDQTGSRPRPDCDDDRPGTSGASLLPRKLCFDEVDSGTRPALRDVNDNARYTPLSAASDLYRQPAATTLTPRHYNTQFDLVYAQRDVSSVGVGTISSTISASAQHGRTAVEHVEVPSSSSRQWRRPGDDDVENSAPPSSSSSSAAAAAAAAFDFNYKRQNAAASPVIRDDLFAAVWRPWWLAPTALAWFLVTFFLNSVIVFNSAGNKSTLGL